MKTNKYQFKRNTIVPCSNVNCTFKDCPNYSKTYKKGSFFFPDCINNPNKIITTAINKNDNLRIQS